MRARLVPRLVPLALALALSGCDDDLTAPQAGEPVLVDVLATGFALGGAGGELEERVVTDREELAEVWMALAAPPGPVPEVDFASETLLVVTGGSAGCCPIQVEFDSAAREGDAVRVRAVRWQTTGCACICIYRGLPVAIAVIPVAGERVVFEVESEERPC